jgi:hypothetical protein
MLTARLDDATPDLLAAICAEAWPEGPTLEFKRELPPATPDGRREFIKDVAALANADGGDIVFGVVEADGRAQALAPIAAESADAATRRLQQTIDAGLEPRLPGPQFKHVDVSGGYVLIVRVPASYLGPHAILNGKDRRFVMRTGTSTSDLTFDQLRAAFDRTATLGEMARQFIADRQALVASRDTPKRLVQRPLVVVHFVPISGLARRQPVDVQSLRQSGIRQVTPRNSGSAYLRFNIDGLVGHLGSAADPETDAYWQFFRYGPIEAAITVGRQMPVPGGSTEMTIRPPRLVDTVRRQVDGMLAIAKGFGLSGPCVFAAGLFGVNSVTLDVEDSWVDPHRALGDRDRMLVPEVWQDDLQVADADRVARSILDVMWQGFGQDRCDYFDEVSGEYRPPRG